MENLCVTLKCTRCNFPKIPSSAFTHFNFFFHGVFYSYCLFCLGLPVFHTSTGLYLTDIPLPSIRSPFIPEGYQADIYDDILLVTL
jgi:hypothetical protein